MSGVPVDDRGMSGVPGDDRGISGTSGTPMSLERIDRASPLYPVRLHELSDPPEALHVAGPTHRLGLISDGESVAIVGTRTPSEYGKAIARTLAAGLAAARVPVISGMAIGIDSVAHEATIAYRGATVAVLAGGAERAHPPSRARLYDRILEDGLIISEQPAGRTPRPWSFAARNRIIAALASATIVVEAGEESGALLTSTAATELGRPVGAVPGRVGTRCAFGPNALLAAGAAVIRGPQDALDLIYGVGAVRAQDRVREPLDAALERLLQAIDEGHESTAALVRAGIAPEQGLAALAQLELSGHVTRGPGGRYTVVA